MTDATRNYDGFHICGRANQPAIVHSVAAIIASRFMNDAEFVRVIQTGMTYLTAWSRKYKEWIGGADGVKWTAAASCSPMAFSIRARGWTFAQDVITLKRAIDIADVSSAIGRPLEEIVQDTGLDGLGLTVKSIQQLNGRTRIQLENRPVKISDARRLMAEAQGLPAHADDEYPHQGLASS